MSTQSNQSQNDVHYSYLHLSDVTTVCYVLDNHAWLRVLPENINGCLQDSVLNLQAANRKLITIYSRRYVYLNVSLRKPIHGGNIKWSVYTTPFSGCWLCLVIVKQIINPRS